MSKITGLACADSHQPTGAKEMAGITNACGCTITAEKSEGKRMFYPDVDAGYPAVHGG